VPSEYLESASTDGGTNPLHDAAKRGNLDLLKECLLNRLPVNQVDAAGGCGAQGGDRLPRELCPALGRPRRPPGLPPHAARCAAGPSTLLALHLRPSEQVQLNTANKLGDTPVCLAAQRGQVRGRGGMGRGGCSRD
jgi:ankyrin repeat protein